MQPIENLAIGKIIEVDGARIIAELDPNISDLSRVFSGENYPIGQFGSIIKVHFGRRSIYGLVSRLRMKADYQLEKGIPVASSDERVIEADIDEAISLINDPSVRAIIKTALDEAKKLKVVNDNLHSAFKNIQIGSNLNQSNKNVLNDEIPESERKEILSFQLIQALKKGINEKRLTQQGMSIEKNGSICNEYGDTIFPPLFCFCNKKNSRSTILDKVMDTFSHKTYEKLTLEM